MKVTYLGHSAFEITTGQSKILIDPFLVCSPNYDINGVTNIFVTHGHGDHLGSGIEISKKTGAQLTAVFELGNYCSAKGANAQGIGLGAWLDYNFGRVIFLPAFHSGSVENGQYTGCPAGILFEIEGTKIFHAGDTCLNSEMKVLKEVFKPDIAILPIGGTYTMDVEQASVAAEWIDAQTVIPMHYNTFDAINADVQLFSNLILKQGKQCIVPQIGKQFQV